MSVFIHILFSTGVLLAQGLYGSADTSQLVLENREDGSVRYVQVVKSQGNKSSEQKTDSVFYRSYSNKFSGGFNSSRPYEVPVEQLTYPIPEIPLALNGQNIRLQRGKLILGKDGEFYIIENLYPDGRIAAYRATVNPNSSRRVHSNFVAEVEENIVIIDVDLIRATQSRCFFGICQNEVYADVQGVPLCDRTVLASYLEDWGAKKADKLSCRLNGAIIHGVFNDGTLVSGKTLFNPFPESLHRYPTDESITNVEI